MERGNNVSFDDVSCFCVRLEMIITQRKEAREHLYSIGEVEKEVALDLIRWHFLSSVHFTTEMRISCSNWQSDSLFFILFSHFSLLAHIDDG